MKISVQTDDGREVVAYPLVDPEATPAGVVHELYQVLGKANLVSYDARLLMSMRANLVQERIPALSHFTYKGPSVLRGVTAKPVINVPLFTLSTADNDVSTILALVDDINKAFAEPITASSTNLNGPLTRVSHDWECYAGIAFTSAPGPGSTAGNQPRAGRTVRALSTHDWKDSMLKIQITDPIKKLLLNAKKNKREYVLEIGVYIPRACLLQTKAAPGSLFPAFRLPGAPE